MGSYYYLVNKKSDQHNLKRRGHFFLKENAVSRFTNFSKKNSPPPRIISLKNNLIGRLVCLFGFCLSLSLSFSLSVRRFLAEQKFNSLLIFVKSLLLKSVTKRRLQVDVWPDPGCVVSWSELLWRVVVGFEKTFMVKCAVASRLGSS